MITADRYTLLGRCTLLALLVAFVTPASLLAQDESAATAPPPEPGIARRR